MLFTLIIILWEIFKFICFLFGLTTIIRLMADREENKYNFLRERKNEVFKG
jgi:hypothetical protein